MTQENATQPGAFESASSARSQAMKQIAQRVHDDLVPELNAFDEASGVIGEKLQRQEPPKEEPQEVQPEAQEQEPAQNTQAAVEQQPQDDGLETIVIDGQERRVKREQIIEAGRRTLQKESAADRRLEEAAETLRRVKAMESALMQRQPSQQGDAGETQMPSEQDASNGTAAQRAATPDLGTLVDERLWLRDADKAAERFKQEFKDIADDPFAARLVVQLENERLAQLAQEGKPVTATDSWQAYQAHGARVREWLGKAKPAGSVQVSTDKAERKRDTVTVTGSTTRTPAPNPQKPPTTSERIEQMRIARMGRAIPISR